MAMALFTPRKEPPDTTVMADIISKCMTRRKPLLPIFRGVRVQPVHFPHVPFRLIILERQFEQIMFLDTRRQIRH